MPKHLANFDYEYLGKCEYGVFDNSPEGCTDCGDPAIAKVWWDEEKRGLLLCNEHFEEIKKKEEEM